MAWYKCNRYFSDKPKLLSKEETVAVLLNGECCQVFMTIIIGLGNSFVIEQNRIRENIRKIITQYDDRNLIEEFFGENFSNKVADCPILIDFGVFVLNFSLWFNVSS